MLTTPASAEVCPVHPGRRRGISSSNHGIQQLYRDGTGTGFDDGLAELFDLPGDAGFEMRSIAQRHEFNPAFQREDPLDGFIDTAAQRGTGACGIEDCLESLCNERRRLR